MHAQQFVSGGLVYEITSPTTVKLSPENNQNPNLSGNITIPETVDYNNQVYTVTEIGYYSFYGLTITSVVIPNTVTTIGYASFSLCQSLTSIVIPNSVIEIGDYAFSLAGLTSVICNASTPPTIGYATFLVSNPEACSLTVPLLSLSAYEAHPIWRQSFNSIIGDGILNTTSVSACSSYTWENTNQTYTATGVYFGTTTNGVTEQLDLTILSNFSNDGINYVVTSPTTVEIVGIDLSATGEIVIPETVTTDCGTYSVTSIGDYAFEYREGITNIIIPNTVTNIGAHAIEFCTNLTSLNIPNSVTHIGNGAFYGCSGLTSVTIPNSVTSLGDYAFIDCRRLISVTIPNSVTGIGYDTFRGCTDLTSVTIPNSVSYIDDSAFRNCTSLTSVTIPNSVTYIGNSTFRGCTGLTSVTIPISVTSISSSTFNRCTSLTSVSIPNSVTSIYSDAFRDCFSLTSVTIPNSVTYIGSSIFRSCTGLTSVTISNSLTSINYNAFNRCTSLTSVTIPNSVTEINEYAFANCTSLSSVTIPDSVTSIWEGAFENCTSLTSVICNVSTPINIDSTVFANVNQAACSLTVPVGSITAYQAATFWQDFIIISNNNNNNLSKVIDSQCGATLSALNTLIRANAITGASRYKFKVVHGATTEIIEPTTSAKWFRLTSLPGGAFYNTTYTISVAVKKNNVWGDFGAECTVTTPAFPTTKVKDSQCGITLASITTFISADAVNAASGYRFKVVNGASTEIIEAASGSRWFRLTSLPGGASYTTTYTISAASRYNGVWSNYGVECAVTTPAAPLSKLIDRQCGMTLASDNATLLYATSVSVAQKYRFEVSLGSDVYTYDTASSSEKSFRMTNVPGLTLVSGTTYTVRVATMINDAWQPYGESCSVTTFRDVPTFVKSMKVDTTTFNVVTYPNPFTENFNINLTSLSEEKVTVMVYDMTGKLLERKEVAPNELTELQIGNNFASGIYNVIVSQGTNTKSLRVIKK